MSVDHALPMDVRQVNLLHLLLLLDERVVELRIIAHQAPNLGT